MKVPTHLLKKIGCKQGYSLLTADTFFKGIFLKTTLHAALRLA